MNRLALALAFSLPLAACGGTLTYGSGNLQIDLTDDRLIIHDHIQFGHDSAEILPESYPLLDAVADVLKENEQRVTGVQIQGHTSLTGSDEHNLELSEARAGAVASYLREHGVTQELTSQGYGEQHPLCQEDTDACHAQNRRVEFFVVHE
ncbi:MAG: OmpA family protein [Sandaracinaceae bacterium]